MWQQNFSKNDVESGPSQPLYPMMLESPELRWSFIRKIYSIVAIQLLFTVFVGAFVVSVRSISTFFTTTGAGLFLYILLIITPFVGKVIFGSCYFNSRHCRESNTFWAVRRGHDFNFLGPFLFGAIMVLMVFGIIQIFFPLGRTSEMIYGCLASVIFCGYIVYDTDNLIKRYSYDEHLGISFSIFGHHQPLSVTAHCFRVVDN